MLQLHDGLGAVVHAILYQGTCCGPTCCRVGTLDYMSPEVVSLPTADERKKMEAAGRPAVEQPYGEKVCVAELKNSGISVVMV